MELSTVNISQEAAIASYLKEVQIPWLSVSDKGVLEHGPCSSKTTMIRQYDYWMHHPLLLLTFVVVLFL